MVHCARGKLGSDSWAQLSHLKNGQSSPESDCLGPNCLRPFVYSVDSRKIGPQTVVRGCLLAMSYQFFSLLEISKQST